MTVVGIEVPPFWIMSQWPFFGLDNLEGKSLETVLAVLKKKKKKTSSSKYICTALYSYYLENSGRGVTKMAGE